MLWNFIKLIIEYCGLVLEFPWNITKYGLILNLALTKSIFCLQKGKDENVQNHHKSRGKQSTTVFKISDVIAFGVRFGLQIYRRNSLLKNLIFLQQARYVDL